MATCICASTADVCRTAVSWYPSLGAMDIRDVAGGIVTWRHGFGRIPVR